MPVATSFKALIGQHSVEKLRNILLDRRPRIFFLGMDEPQDRSGTLQALAKISDLTFLREQMEVMDRMILLPHCNERAPTRKGYG